MVTTCDRVLAIYIETSSSSSSSSNEKTAIDAFAAEGCNGTLVFSEGGDTTSLDRLQSVLGVKPQSKPPTFLYPKMPVTFWSTSDASCALAHALGFESVEKLTSQQDEDTERPSRLFQLLLAPPATSKRFVFVHIETPETSALPANHWIQTLLTRVLAYDPQSQQQQQQQQEIPKFVVSVIQTARQPLQTLAGDPTSPFYPKQSYLKVDHKYLVPRDQYSRLLYCTYGLDAVRKDTVQHLEDDQVDQHGAYGAMHVGVLVKETAFRLGFAPKYGA